MPDLVRHTFAFAIVYCCGYVTGSLLLDPKHDRASFALGLVRTAAGFMLTAVAYLLSLRLALPWFAGPAALVALAMFVHRRAALLPP